MVESFEGGVFSERLEGGRSGAKVTLSGEAVTATVPDGQSFSLPFRDVDLSIGGASGRMWFCRSRDRSLTIFSESAKFVTALEAHAGRALSEQFASLSAQRTQGARRRGLQLTLLLLATGIVLAAAALGVRHVGRVVALALPTSVDRQLGDLAVEHMDLGGTVLEDAKLSGALQKVMARLEQTQPSKFKFRTRIVDAPLVNAFALPGGALVVYTGLLREAQTAEQLAGVLAHEMAHVTRRHGMQRIAQSLGIVAAIQLFFGDVSGVMAVAVEVLREGAINSYSRDQEHEADMDAVGHMRRAALKPAALADFFVLLKKHAASLPSGLSWLGTHPDLDERIRDVRALAAKSESSALRPLDLDWLEVQRHAGKKLD